MKKHRSRWRINSDICHRNRTLCVTLASLLVYSLMLTCISALDIIRKGYGRRGLAGDPQIGAQRHYRPPYFAWFIHKYQRIAISQRCHHFAVAATPLPLPLPPSPPPPPPPFTPQSNMIIPSPSYLCPLSLSPLLTANMAVRAYATYNSHDRGDQTPV